MSLKTCQEMAAIEGLSGPVDGAHPDDDVPGDVGDAMAGVRPRHRSSRAGYRAQKVKAQRAVADSVAAQQDGVASPEARPSPAVGNQSQGCSPTVKLDVASTELSLTNTTVSGPAASASGSSHVSSLADPTAVGPPPAQDSGVLHGPLSPVTCADHTPSPADEMVRPTMKAEQPSPSTMSDKTHDETDVAEPMSSAQEPRQVDARPSGLFVASSSGQAAEDALPLAAGPVDVMVRPAMNVPQHPLPSTPNGNAPGAAAGTHPVASLREEPRQVDAEPAVSSTGSCSGLKDQDGECLASPFRLHELRNGCSDAGARGHTRSGDSAREGRDEDSVGCSRHCAQRAQCLLQSGRIGGWRLGRAFPVVPERCVM